MPVLNAQELKVLKRLVVGFNDCCYNFRGLSRHTRLKRADVRRACRSLARKGFARYERALWNEDGGPAGAGYGATRAGYDLLTDPQWQ